MTTCTGAEPVQQCLAVLFKRLASCNLVRAIPVLNTPIIACAALHVIHGIIWKVLILTATASLHWMQAPCYTAPRHIHPARPTVGHRVYLYRKRSKGEVWLRRQSARKRQDQVENIKSAEA